MTERRDGWKNDRMGRGVKKEYSGPETPGGSFGKANGELDMGGTEG